MSLQAGGLMLCLLLTFVTHGQGLQFSMDRTPDTVSCGRLQCFADIKANDSLIFSVIGLNIVEVTQTNKTTRLASVTVFNTDPKVEPSKTNVIIASSDVSENHTQLTLALRHELDCHCRTFLCEMKFLNVNGQADAIKVVVAPEKSTNYSSKLCSKTEPVESMETCTNDMEINLAEQKHQNVTEEKLNNLLLKMDGIEQFLNSTVGMLSTMVEQMKTQTGDIDRDHAELRRQNEDMKTKLDNALYKISNVEQSVNSSCEKPLTTCVKAMARKKPREKLKLWDNIMSLCDTETDGGGWIVIQRRTQGDVDFYRGWNDYKNGFGNPDTDFWIGNDVIHNLTSQGYTDLRIELKCNGTEYFAEYSNVKLANEMSNYQITLGEYNGTAEESLRYYHNGMSFSTYDRDNDRYDKVNCARKYHGAWWYNACCYTNLNGLWKTEEHAKDVWVGTCSNTYPSFIEMKVRHV